MKFPYFADTIERGDRGWKEAQRQDEDRVTSRITLLSSGILSGILDPVHEMEFGLCMKTSKKRFCHSLHFPNMSQKVTGETKGWVSWSVL
jgi:hypothetical protein